jgi:hypothetical protein
MADVFPGIGDYLARSNDIDLGSVLDEVAHGIELYAVGLAAEHVKSGDYVDSIKITIDRSSESKRDRYVYSDDVAAMSIEYGHLSGSQGDEHRTPVAGQHIFGRAAEAVEGPQ